VARGNVLLAAREKRPIPGDWAIGRDGRPTTDAAEALLGAMLPVGGHKGLGLAMLVQVLAGSLTGAAPRTLAGQGAAASVGAFGLVVDPDLLVGRAAFDAHMRSWIGEYLEAVGEHGRLPGRGETLARIPLPRAIRDELVALGDRVGVPFDSWRADR
jgi:LDH2 family malate/lactate/ureidoglycolate dehydrogenase